MTISPAHTQQKQEKAGEEKFGVVSTGSYSVVAAKLLVPTLTASSIPLVLRITNQSPNPVTVDHSIVSGKVFPAKIVLVPLGAEQAKEQVSGAAGPGKADALADLRVVVEIPGGDATNAAAPATEPSSMTDEGNRTVAAETLSAAVETNYLSKTTIKPNGTADGLVMLKLMRSDGTPIRGASELVSQVINAHVIVGADIHIFRVSFAPLNK